MRRLGWVCVASILLQACGGGGSSPTAPSSIATPAPSTPPLPPPPASATVLYEGSFTTLPGNGASGRFSVPGTGTLTVAVTWDAPGAALTVALTDERCTNLRGALAGTCFNLGAPDVNASRPKTFSVQIGSASSVVVWVGNVGQQSAAGSVRVWFTPAVVPTPPPPPPVPPPPPTFTCNGASVPALVDCLNDLGTRPPTAKCNDGRFSCSSTRSGTCSGHGGVACWVCPGPLCS